jgi:hypothetical protein
MDKIMKNKNTPHRDNRDDFDQENKENIKVVNKTEDRLFNAEQAAITKGYNTNYIFVVKKKFNSSEKKTLLEWFKLFKETGIE